MNSEWYELIGRPQFVVAPMVDASELAWRLLCRKHGATLCYTPMLHSTIFTKDPKYRKENFTTCSEDRPLIVQFCGNNPETISAAAKYVELYCDAIDINLGCPQSIAKRGRYGSYLQDDWDLLKRMGEPFKVQQKRNTKSSINCIVQLESENNHCQYSGDSINQTNDCFTTMSVAVSVPITCKVRIFDSIEKSVQYALMLQESGCKLLTVHGRTREQKGPLTGIARWQHIKAIREAISIPMFANGNIQCLEDVHRCLEYTKVNGVMSAEGILTNPAMFEGVNAITWEIALEYLDFVQKYPCPSSFIRGHLFKIFHKIFSFESNNNDRQLLATAQCIDDFKQVSLKIMQKYLPYHLGELSFEDNEGITRNGWNLILPPWLCQPYVRISPEEHTQKMDNLSKKQDKNSELKRSPEDENFVSKKKMKKMQRIMRRPPKPDTVQSSRNGEICDKESCPNPLGGKCEYRLCKKCCRNKCFEEDLDCKGHRILVHTRREMAKKFAPQRKTECQS